MQSQTNLGSVNRSAAERRVPANLTARHRPARTAAPSAGTSSSSIDARIGSLRILAQSLMRQIEALQIEAASGSTVEFDAQTEVRRFEAELIRSALISTGGRQRRAAHLLGMKVTTLNTKIKRYQINLEKEALLHKSPDEFQPEEFLEVS